MIASAFSRSISAWRCATLAILGLGNLAAAQAPLKGEYILPANPVASVEVRAIAPVKFNPSGSRAFLTASGAVVPGGPGRFQYLDSNGVLPAVPFSASAWIPTGAGGWYDPRSIDQQVTNGNVVVAGIASGGGATRPSVLLLTSRLGHIANVEPGGADPTDPSLKALALPSGNIVQMLHAAPVAGKPTAWLICYTSNLALVWWHTFTTTNCDQLHFNDMKEFGGKLYLVGDINPQSAHPRPFLLIVGADSSIASEFGKPLKMWSFDIGGAPGITSRFTAVTVVTGPGGDPSVWIGGQNAYVSGGFGYHTTRVVGVNGASGVKTFDYEYGMSMTTAPGSIWHIPGGHCGAGVYTDRIYLGGHRLGQVARHMRIDPFTPATSWGSDFSAGEPPLAAFHAMVPASDPSYVLLGGRYRVSNQPGTYHDRYLVMTDCDGATSCSTPWTAIGAIGTFAPVAESPIQREFHEFCDGTQGGIALLVSRNFQEHFDVGTGTFTYCPGCSVDLDGDDEVGGSDLALVLGNWGECVEGPCNADLNGDGAVNGADIGMVLGEWGTICR